MADGQEFTSSPSYQFSQETNEVTISEIIKSTLLYICEDNLLWKGDLESLKSSWKRIFNSAEDGRRREGKPFNLVISSFV